MALNARNKGSSGERELASLLMGWALEMGQDLAIQRNLDQWRAGGYDLDGVPGLAIEVKRVEALAPQVWWKQAVRQAEAKGMVPFLAYRQNRKPWRFMVRAPVTFLDTTGAAAGALWLDMALELEQAKIWFQSYLHYKGLEIAS